MKNKILLLLVFFLIWRIVFFAIGSKADLFVKYQPSFPNLIQLQKSQLAKSVYSWGNFDGVHYLTIVEKGYLGTGLIQAFFPGYPVAVKLINALANNQVISGLVISNFFFILTMIVFYKLLRLDLSEKTTVFSIVSLLLFPTSFFFVGVYSESMFLFFVLSAFYFARIKHWWLVSMFIALASFTRIVGVFLVPALLFELVQQYSKQSPIETIKKYWHVICLISIGSIGLLIYMVYLKIVFHDPLYFYHLQNEFGAGRQEKIILIPQVIWRYLKILITARPIDLKYFAYAQELISSLFALSVMIFSIKKVRLSYLLFSIFAFALPTLTGTFSSMPRYVLVCFPIYIWLGLIYQQMSQKTIGKVVILSCFIASSLLLCLNLIMFLQGHWVA